MISKLFVALLAVLPIVQADIYMHNPRGSNDRNCERNTNRNNGNRLFDSQNNDKGGYACPRAVGGPEMVTPQMYYYEGSKLTIEWWNQHGCNNPNVDCNLVFQYMCAPTKEVSVNNPYYALMTTGLRDGTPTDANDAATDRMDPDDVDDPRYGYHENYAYYAACSTRSRNYGLWTADQQVNGQSAAFTRQNPNANRRGWECTEERDYYPYWHPAPWKDIAILTTRPKMCGYYMQNTQNTHSKYWCMTSTLPQQFTSQNTEGNCVAAGNMWVEVPAWGIAKPACDVPQYSRDNHLGNTIGGDMQSYVWTIPNVDETMNSCVLRVRYNISNADVDWDFNSTMNNDNSPVQTDPTVHIMGKDTENDKQAINLTLAVNTDQYGRTFQDRSYVFAIKKRSDGNAPAEGDIWNINVRGKRGNIVATYPAVEYDFVPRILTVQKGDYVHWQWAGSDYNPNSQPNNAVGGPVDPVNADNYRADRSNVVPIQKKWQGINPTQPGGKWFGVMTPDQMVSLAYANQDMNDCLTYDELFNKNGGNDNQIYYDSQNCAMLNAAKTPYYDMGPVQMTQPGAYTYFSSRNNNFSNRNQRASITVNDSLSTKEKAAIGVGATAGAAGVAGGGAYMYKRGGMK